MVSPGGSETRLPRLERYDVLRQIGEGGMGVVYEARDRATGERVALKTFRERSASDLRQLKHEFRALAAIHHPNVVRLHELAAEGDQWFLVMELVEGVDLVSYVRAGLLGPIPVGDATPTELVPAVPAASAAPTGARRSLGELVDLGRLEDAFGQLAGALSALHAAGIVHGDLKPSNVLVTQAGRVVLMDFGIARARREGTGEAYSFAGTPMFMAPELLAGEPASAATDAYALGVLLYQVLTDRLPVRDVLDQLRTREAPSHFTRDVPHVLDGLCHALVAVESFRRPDLAEVAARLRREAPSAAPGPVEAALLGRQAHLDALRAAWQRAAGRTTEVVFVHGASGMGKSALVERFLAEVSADPPGALVLSARCYEQAMVPYKAVDGVVDALSQRVAGDESLLAALSAAERDALGVVFPVFEGTGGRARGEQRPDPRELRREAFSALRTLLTRLCEQHRVVIHLEDLQWGDADSAVLLETVLRAPSPPPVFVLGSYRSEDAGKNALLAALLPSGGQGRGPFSRATRIEVGPLEPDAATALALHLLGPTGTAARARAVAQESKGHPLHVRELALFSGANSAPVGLDEVLWQRISALPEAARRLLEAVAVASVPLSLRLAARVAGVEEPGLLRAARAELVVGNLARPHGDGEDHGIESFHDRVRESLLQHLEPRVLRARHGSVADALEATGRADPELLVHHYLAAALPERATLHVLPAARKAERALAFERAAQLYGIARELAPEGVEPLELRVRRAAALTNAGRSSDAADELLEAARLAEPERARSLRREAGQALLQAGRLDEGVDVLAALLREVGVSWRYGGRGAGAVVSLLAQRARLALRGMTPRTRGGPASPDRLERADLFHTLGKCLGVVDSLRALECETRFVLDALDIPDDAARHSAAMAFEAAALGLSGPARRARTRELAAKAEALAQQARDPTAVAIAWFADGIAAVHANELQHARARFESALRVLREECTGVSYELTSSELALSWVLFWLGDLRALQARIPAALADARERGDVFAQATLSNGYANAIWLAADDADGARREADAGMARWSQRDFMLQHFWHCLARVHERLYAGDGAAARALVEAAWPGIRSALLLRPVWIRAEILDLRARTWVLAAREAPPSERRVLHRAIAKAASAIGHSPCPAGAGFAAMLRAAIAAQGGRAEAAATELATASRIFGRLHMALHRAAAERQRGLLVGGDAGAAAVAAAEAELHARGARDLARMARVVAPAS